LSEPLTLDIDVQRETTNKLNDDKLNNQVKDIAAACLKRSNCVGVTSSFSKLRGPFEMPSGKYLYDFTVRIKKQISRSENAATKAIENAKRHVVRAAEARGWSAKDEADRKEAAAIAEARAPFTVGELNNEIMEKYFNGVYERENHIWMIHNSVTNAIKTDYEERTHILLYGPPASCKSVLFDRLKAWYEEGSEIERVAKINSTTISKAGLEQWLLDKATTKCLPEILYFDEIEKFKMENLECLLAVMDGQGTISRLNARIGKVSAIAKVIIWATCNDVEKLKAFNSEAMWSRFIDPIPCVRPSKDLMYNILLTRIAARRARGLNADDKWAKVAVDYGFDVMKTDDPRKIIGLLAGEDKLLDGSFFKMKEAIQDAYNKSLASGLH